MNMLKSLAFPAFFLSSWVVLVGAVFAALQPPSTPLPLFVEPVVTIIVPTTTRA